MTLGGANVWTNFSYGYRNESPSGWLLSPDRSRLISVSYTHLTLPTTPRV